MDCLNGIIEGLKNKQNESNDVQGNESTSNGVRFHEFKPGDTVRLIQPDSVVVCLDNTGIEEQFEVGIEYIFEPEESKDGMLVVYDKTGQKRTCFPDRFRIVSRPVGGFQMHFIKNREGKKNPFVFSPEVLKEQ